MQSMGNGLGIRPMEGRLSIVRMDPHSEVPAWASACAFSACIRTSEELTTICDQAAVPVELIAERDWVALEVEGPLAFTMTGVLSKMLEPLATDGIAVFVLSTFSTDYILVKTDTVVRALDVLRRAGYRIL
jgi:uncharacterized protein